MDDNDRKYQVIDPESEEYKLTDKDLKKEKKKRRKVSAGAKVLIAVLIVLIIIFGSGAFLINSYLSKLNYGDSKGTVNPSLDKEEEISFEAEEDISKQEAADVEIKKNLDDNIMWYDEKVINILLVGVDYGDDEKVMFEGAYLPRSDSMTLISLNLEKNIINMVSLSRAVYVAIPGHGNKRLNTAHAYGGSELLVETIQNNYKIRIDKYVTVDISGFAEIVDILGGVTVEMSAKEAEAILSTSKEGSYHLNGAQAVMFTRLHSIDSDRMRTGRQRKVLNAIAAKLRRSSVSTMVNLLDEILPLVTTNFSKTELIGQAANARKYLGMTINQDIIPHNATALTMRDGKEVLILNWAETKSYVHNLLYPDMTPQSAEDAGE